MISDDVSKSGYSDLVMDSLIHVAWNTAHSLRQLVLHRVWKNKYTLRNLTTAPE